MVGTRTVYKVLVRSKDEKLKSITVFEQKWVVEYTPNSTTIPRVQGSLLFAFDNLENAAEYMIAGTEVWEAEAESPCSMYRVGNSDFTFFWRLWSQYQDRNIVTLPDRFPPAPFGTVGCTAIKLVRKVTEEEIRRAAFN